MSEKEALGRILQALENNSTELDLTGLKLDSLPAELFNLTTLEWLYLGNNQLTSLPKQIGQMANLEGLDLTDNQLTSLPKQIGQLSCLGWLPLAGNRLARLPEEIGQLTRLNVMYLGSNQLASLPPEIGLLKNLKELYLYDNQLTELPVEIGQMKSLKVLSFGDNQLTSLPREIGQLENLTELSFSGNGTTILPREIGQLENLMELSFSGNALTALPREIGLLKKLERLELYNNPLPLETMAAHKQGLDELRAYLINLPATRTILCLKTEGDVTIGEHRAYLAAIENTYNSLCLFEEIIENAIKKLDRGEKEKISLKWPTTKEIIALRIPKEKQLRLHNVQLASLGTIEVLATGSGLIPLEHWIIQAVRHRREYCSNNPGEVLEGSEFETLLLEDNWAHTELQKKVEQLRELIRHSNQRIHDQLHEIPKMREDLLKQPLRSIAFFIARHHLVDAELVHLATPPAPKQPGSP